MIGTLARQAREQGMDVLIVTGDRDLLQLVNDTGASAGHPPWHSGHAAHGLRASSTRSGVPPERVADLKGLMGDSSDNIPGVPRIGPKTAVKLLQQYGTLENVLANADAIRGQVGENLRAYEEQARLSKELSIIRPTRRRYSTKRRCAGVVRIWKP